MSVFQCYLNRKKLVNTGAEKKKKGKKGNNMWLKASISGLGKGLNG